MNSTDDYASAATLKDLRSFGIILGCGVIVIFGLFFPWLGDRPWPLWPWIFAAVSALAGITIPGALRPLFRIWMKIGGVLGWINTRIILCLVFYLVVAPFGMVMRVFGWDAMMRGFDPSAPSYRRPSKVRPASHLEKPY